MEIVAIRWVIALRTAGERERMLGDIRIAQWSICRLRYGRKRGNLGTLTLLVLVPVELK